MDETTKKILKNIAGSTVRTALQFVAAWLVRKGVITDEQGGLLVHDLTPVALGVLVSLAGLAWSYWQKVHANRKVDAALVASPVMSRAEFERAHDRGALSATGHGALLLCAALLLSQAACGGAPSRDKLVKVAGYGIQLEATLEANWTLPDSLHQQGLITAERRDQVKGVFTSARAHVRVFNDGMRRALAEERPNVAALAPAVADLIADVRQLSAGVESEAYRKTLAAIEASLRAIANYFALARAEAHARGYTDRHLASAAGAPYDPAVIDRVVSYAGGAQPQLRVD